jgi:hypothetical protein
VRIIFDSDYDAVIGTSASDKARFVDELRSSPATALNISEEFLLVTVSKSSIVAVVEVLQGAPSTAPSAIVNLVATSQVAVRFVKEDSVAVDVAASTAKETTGNVSGSSSGASTVQIIVIVVAGVVAVAVVAAIFVVKKRQTAPVSVESISFSNPVYEHSMSAVSPSSDYSDLPRPLSENYSDVTSA